MNDAMNGMAGQASWVTLAMFLVGALGIGLLLLLSARVTHRYPTSALAVLCPASGKSVDCTAVFDLTAGKWINISSCPSLAFPSCGRECLRPLKQP